MVFPLHKGPKGVKNLMLKGKGSSCLVWPMVQPKEYEILRSPGSGASLLKTGQVYNYCAMRGICLLNRAISPTFLPFCPGHSRFHLLQSWDENALFDFRENENLTKIQKTIAKFLQKYKTHFRERRNFRIFVFFFREKRK